MPSLIDTLRARTPDRVRDAWRRVREGRDWNRRAVGGAGARWDLIGKLQFDYLVEQGLRPEHRLLDVGCGSLRGGVHFVHYLESGHYYGIDISGPLLAAGRRELRTAGLVDKEVTLRVTDTFDVDFGVRFEFALAQSVFTHLPLNSIHRCLLSVAPCLVPGGRFYATIFPNPGGRCDTRPVTHPVAIDAPPVTTYPDRDPFHYDPVVFDWLCEGTGLVPSYLGEWGHPFGQHMMVFERVADAGG